MLRVLHVVPATPFGGLQRLAVSLAAEQRRTGINAEILSIYDGREIERLMQASQVPYLSTRCSGPSVAALKRAIHTLRRSWDIVHVHAGLLWCNALALFFKDSPVVFHAHNYPSKRESLRDIALKEINRLLTNSVFAVSEDVARAWRREVPAVPVHCVYNGIRLPPDPPPSRRRLVGSPVVFGMATRLAADKGLREFVDAAQAIHARLPYARFVIAGSGPQEQALRSEIASRGLTEVITLCGYVEDVEAFWERVDIALFTAPGEPFGLRIIEPMRQGIPVLAYLTRAGSDEILRPGVNAAAVPFGHTDALASAADAVVTDELASQRMSAAAFRDLYERFSLSTMSERISDLYRRMA